MRDRGGGGGGGGEGGGGGGEEEGSLGMVSSFSVDSSVPFRPADPTRKVKHTMHYGGVNKKGVPKRERKKKLTKVESYLNQVFFKLVNFVFLFCQPPQTKCPCICDFNLSCKPQPGRKKGQTKQLTLCHLGRLAWPRAQSLSLSLSVLQAKWK